MSLTTSDAILLRSHEYSESSRIFRFLTPDLGILSIIGKGVKARSAKGEAPIQTFGEVSLTFFHRSDRDLHTLREIQDRGDSLSLGRGVRRFAGASLIAELLLVYNMEEGDPDLYEWVREVFRRLATAPDAEVPAWILAGAWRTLAQMGFPPRLSHCVRCSGVLAEDEEIHHFDVPGGGLVCENCSMDLALPRVGPEARRQLTLLVVGKPPLDVRGEQAHLSLLDRFATHHLAPKHPYRSFDMLRSLMNKTTAEG